MGHFGEIRLADPVFSAVVLPSDMCVCGWLGGWLMEAADCIQLYKNPVCVV